MRELSKVTHLVLCVLGPVVFLAQLAACSRELSAWGQISGFLAAFFPTPLSLQTPSSPVYVPRCKMQGFRALTWVGQW